MSASAVRHRTALASSPGKQTGTVLVVDAANVVGSRPNGWWRDRGAATRTFVEQIRAAVDAGRIGQPVVVVLEGRSRSGFPSGSIGDLTVLHASGAGDDLLVDVVAGAGGRSVCLVTADRELRQRAAALGADVVGPRWLWRVLE